MKLTSKVSLFMTGRQYSKNGQRILWAKVEPESEQERRDFLAYSAVVFSDLDRGIDGVIEDLAFCRHPAIGSQMILALYDKQRYRPFNCRQILVAAAEAEGLVL